jgi:PAS domain S-box-containing protein
MWWDSEPSTLQIGLDVARTRDRELLSGLFEDAAFVEFSAAVPPETDLCLVDRAALDRGRDRFTDWHDQQAPVFAPVVLLSEQSAQNPWQVFGPSLSEYVDSVVTIPMPKAELRARVQNLLRMRSFSKELTEEQQLRQLIFESSPVGKFVLELDGTVVQANERAAELFDTDPSALVGTQYFDETRTPVYDDGTEIPDSERPFTTVVETGQSVYGYEHRIERRGAADSWVSVNMAPIRDGSGAVEYVVAILEDTTDQHRREAELRRMQNAVDNAPIGITLSDPTQEDNPLIYVNSGFVEQTGYSREEALGRNCRFLQGEGTDEATVAELRRAIDAEEPVSVTIRNYRADGSAYWNYLEVAPVHDDDGEVVNFIGFQQDVTDLIERRRQLQLLGRYLRHNLRNSMNVVQGYAEAIEAEADPLLSEYAERIDDRARQLLADVETERTITSLLRSESEPAPVEVVTLLEGVIESCALEYPDASITFSGPDAVTARAIPELPTALEELVTNAVEHNDGERAEVRVEVTVTPESVTVAVADDGPPIPDMEVDVLADAETETSVYHGQGLGLWMVYIVVQHSGGHLSFGESSLGGNVVTIELPRADPE